MEFLVPFIRDKESWPKPPDVMHDREWPMRQASLLFAGLAYAEPSYIELWRKLPADSNVDEVIRNFFIRQPALWLDPADGSPTAPKSLPRTEWGAPEVQATQAGDEWTIAGRRQRVVLDVRDLSFRVQAGAAEWRMQPSAAGDLRVRVGGKTVTLRLADATHKAAVRYDAGFKTGVKLVLSGWRAEGAPVDLALFLTLALEGAEEQLAFDAAAEEKGATVRQLDWPGALEAAAVDYTVLPNVRGNLIPRGWPQEFDPIRPPRSAENAAPDTSEIQSNVIESWSMSFWGFKKGPAAMMVIVETPNDAAYQFHHPAGGPTVIGPRWRASLGRLAYPRAGRMCFFADGTYVTLAKRYRRHAMETGLFVSPPQAFPGTRFGTWKEGRIPFMRYAPTDLRGLLAGGVPQASLEELEANMDRVRQMSALNERLALVEMTGHEFLDAGYRKERATFADGTTVTVDWDANTATVWP
jgi:hypothetical protein